MLNTDGVDNQIGIRAAQELLKTLAIAIEAVGSLDRAIEIGLVGGRDSDLMRSGLLDIVPLSRGGENLDSDADDRWTHVLAAALLERGFAAVDEMKALAGVIEQAARMAEMVSAGV